MFVLSLSLFSLAQVNPPAKQIDAAQSANHKTQTAQPQNQPQAALSIEEAQKPDIKPQQSPADVEHDDSKQNDNSTFWTLIINAVLTIITLGIAVTGIIQALAAKRSVEALIIQNRPWLLVEKVEEPYLVPVAAAPSGQERFSHCFVKIRNFGHTPAKVTGMRLELQIGENPSNPPFDCIPEKVKDIYVFPQGETRSSEGRLRNGGFISEGDRKMVVDDHIRYLFLVGCIIYRDTFERKDVPEYETRFCYLYETLTNAPKPFWTEVGPKGCNRAT